MKLLKPFSVTSTIWKPDPIGATNSLTLMSKSQSSPRFADGSHPTVLVVGFNVRPLARSARQAGFRVLAVDYWGDLDLPQWAHRHVAVLHQQPDQRPDRPQAPTAQVLVEAARRLLEEAQEPVHYLLFGGGFDDHPDELAQLATLAPLTGNTPALLRRARDRDATAALARRSGAAVPSTHRAASSKAFLCAANRLSLPIVVKPLHGSGGFHTRVLRSQEEVERYAQRHPFSSSQPMLVQEHISGTDASVSVLGTGRQSLAISVNEQLIGVPRLGKGRTKAYCGNVVPLHASLEVVKLLASVAEEMTNQLGLIGSNGFDFVVSPDGTPYFMEVNPRFQATIEAIEMTTGANLVKLHLDACRGRLPPHPPRHRATCARVIVYARRRCIIPDLRGIPGLVDIPAPGSHADPSDPICTVNHVASNRERALQGAWRTINHVYSLLKPLPQP